MASSKGGGSLICSVSECLPICTCLKTPSLCVERKINIKNCTSIKNIHSSPDNLPRHPGVAPRTIVVEEVGGVPGGWLHLTREAHAGTSLEKLVEPRALRVEGDQPPQGLVVVEVRA